MVSELYKRRGVGRKILLAALILIIGSIFIFGQRGLIRWYRLERMSQVMEIRNDSLETEIQVLSLHIQALQEGDSFELERIARHWGMVRSGEEVYIVREEGDSLQTLP